MCAKQLAAPTQRVACSSRRPPALAAVLPRRPRAAVRVAAYGNMDTAMQSIESWVDHCIAAAGASAAGAARHLQAGLLALALALQRLAHWAQLAAAAVAMQTAAQQPQLVYAGGDGGSSDDATSSTPPPAAVHLPSDAAQPLQHQEEVALAASTHNPMINFFSAATTGAVEQLRHTLMDASQGIESKMTCIERTASSVQGKLFKAAQEHSEAVRSNPQVGMWKHSSIEAVLSEEECLREAVFAQVYAELCQKDNKSLSFNVNSQS